MKPFLTPFISLTFLSVALFILPLQMRFMTPRTVQLKKLEDDRGGGSGSGEMKCYHHYNDQGPEHDTYCGVPPKCQERVGKEFKDLDKCPY